MFDKNEELINVIDPESLLENTQVQELNGLITTVVSAPYSKELEEAFYVGSRDVDDNNIFWLYKVDKRTKENSVLTLYGTYSLFDELKAYGLIRDKRPTNATAMVGASAVLEGSRWQVGNITSTHTGTANWYYVGRLEAFWEYLENWNVEFKPRMTFSKGKITGRYIDIVDKLSDDYGKWYEYGDKLLHITAEHASNSLYTAFIGRGKGEEVGDGYGRRIGFNDVVWKTSNGNPVDKPLGQDYVEITSATELYGYSDGKPRTTVVTFEDTEDPSLLLEQTYEYALNECRPKLQMKADVLETGLSELGETCTIIRDDIGIRYKTRVFKLTRDFLNKNKKTVEFGDEIVQSTAKRNSNTAKEIKKQEDRIIYWLDGLRQELVDSYFNEDGYNYDLTADNEYDLPAGYYSFDRPIDASPTKVIYMGAGKLMIANSKNPDGQWNWTTAINGDGANLSAVNTGLLQAGRIQSAVDGSFWDLDNGLMDLKSGRLIGNALEINLNNGRYTTSGEYLSNWDGDSKLRDITTILENGMLRIRNLQDHQTLYFSNSGISTMIDGSGLSESNEPIASGTLQFFDKRYGDTRGVTLQSHMGDVALRTTALYQNIILDSANNIEVRMPSSEYYMNVTGRIRSEGYTHKDGQVNTYIGAEEELRITNRDYWNNGDTNYQRFRASIGYVNGIQTNTFNGGNFLYLGTPDEVRVVASFENNTTYKPIRASEFNVSSSREYKKNIDDFEGSALDLINGTTVKEYNLNDEIDDVDYKHVGLIAEESPLEIINFMGGSSLSLYGMASLLWKGEQELHQEVKVLKEENKSLKKELEQIKEHLGLA